MLIFAIFINNFDADIDLIYLQLKIIGWLLYFGFDFFFFLQSECTVVLFGALVLLLECLISYSIFHTWFKFNSFFPLLQLKFFQFSVDSAWYLLNFAKTVKAFPYIGRWRVKLIQKRNVGLYIAFWELLEDIGNPWHGLSGVMAQFRDNSLVRKPMR